MRQFLMRVTISAGFIGLLFYLVREDIPQIFHALKHVDKSLLVFSVFIFFVSVGVMAKRLQLIFAAEDVKIPFLETSNLTFVGYFFNNFLPTSVGGDIVKAMCAAKITGAPVKSVTSVLMDRIFGLFTFILIPSVSLLFFLKNIENRWVPIVTYSFLGLALFCFFMLFNRGLARRFKFIEHFLNRLGVGQKVRKIYDGLHNFKNHKRVVAEAMFLSLLGQSVSIFVLYLMAVALGARASLIYFYLLVPVVQLLSMLPSLNGLGIREGAYIYFLTPYIGRESAAALGVLWLGVLFLLSLAGGVIYFFRHDYHLRFGKNAQKFA
jgi:uncharacterized protein (TIRG00374 family)